MHTQRIKTEKEILNKPKGFTLVELIIVITILAVLATIAFISFKSYSGNARDGNRLTTLNNIQKGLDIYQVKVGNYPHPDDVYGTGMFGGVELNYVGEIGDNISRVINMNKTPIDPKIQNNYVYGVSSNYQKYQIATTLEELEANIIVPTTYAAQGKAKVVGNYIYPLRLGSKIYSLPSLIFVGNGDLISDSTFTGFIVNSSGNLPYSLDGQLSNNVNIAEQLQQITGTGNLTLTGVDVSNIKIDDLNDETKIKDILENLGIKKEELGTILFPNTNNTNTNNGSGNSGNNGENGNCQNLPANAVYYGLTTEYSLSNISSGTNLTATFATHPQANTCQFRCADTHTWDGTQCRAVTNPICFGLLEGNYESSFLVEEEQRSFEPGNYLPGTIYYKWDHTGRQNGCGGRDTGGNHISPNSGNGNEIIVPTYLNGVEIKHIAPFGLCLPGEGCSSYELIQYMTLPPTLITIGYGAIYDLSLNNITIPNGVTSIGNQAFASNRLNSITIPSSVTSLGDYVVENNGPSKSGNITDWVSGVGGTWNLSGTTWVKQ